MKSTTEILSLIAELIGELYFRPLSYGGTPDGVETLLLAYHELWADIHDDRSSFRDVYWKLLELEDCGSAGFGGRFQIDHPDASHDAVLDFALPRWQEVSERMSIPVPYERIERELKASGITTYRGRAKSDET